MSPWEVKCQAGILTIHCSAITTETRKQMVPPLLVVEGKVCTLKIGILVSIVLLVCFVVTIAGLVFSSSFSLSLNALEDSCRCCCIPTKIFLVVGTSETHFYVCLSICWCVTF